MRLCRYDNGKLGLVRNDEIYDATAALEALPALRYPFPRQDLLIANLPSLRAGIERAAEQSKPIAAADVRFLSPVANPGKLVAAPVNYLKHLEEAQTQSELHHNNRIAEIHQAGLFLKATSSLVGPGEGVTVRFPDRRNDHEIELVAIIGKTANHVKAADALDYIAGYAIGLDMTVRGPEERSLRKSLDTYSVVGPWMVTADEFGAPSNVDLLLTVNGETRQRANTNDLVIDVPGLIEFATRYYTLYPGDLLFTGTPEGVGPVVKGDLISASISRIGTMSVPVS